MLHIRHATPLLAAVLGCLFTACGGETAPPADTGDAGADGGTAVVALSSEPSTLLPVLVRNDFQQAVVEVVYDRLADIGPDLQTVGDAGFIPRLASGWQWSADSLSIAFALDERARWHDGTPVSSEDVRRSFALYADPQYESPIVDLFANIDSVSITDSLTATFWFKRRSPLQFYDAAYHMFIMPAHLLGDAGTTELARLPLASAPVGTGRFHFVNWTRGSSIEIVADTGNYRTRAHLDRVLFVFASDVGAATVKVFTGEADFFMPLGAESVAEAVASPLVNVVPYRTLGFQFVGFNLRDPADPSRPHPVLGDRAVRRALSMATNRERIVQAVFDSLGTVARAPAPRVYLPDDLGLTTLDFDVAAARALLDSAGWVASGSDSVRSRNGVRLRIQVAVPAASPNRDRMLVLLQDQLRSVGAEIVVQRLEIGSLIALVTGRKHDAYMAGLNVSPGLVGLRQNWTTAAIGGDGSNYSGYSNPTFDAATETFLTSFDPAVIKRALATAMQTIVDDAPGIWLVEELSPAGMSTRIEPGVLPSIGWWHGLPEWQIPPERRIERDRIGLPTSN